MLSFIKYLTMEKSVQLSTLLVGIGTVISVVVLSLWYQKRRKHQIPTKWELAGKVTELYLYPLKSGRRIPLKNAEFTMFGPRQTAEEERVYQMRDRELLVYDSKTKEFKTARTMPKLLQIEVSVHDEDYFALDAPNMRTLFVKRPKDGEAQNVLVAYWCGDKIQALDCGNEAALWLSQYFLDEPSGLRLVHYNGKCTRDISTDLTKYLAAYKTLDNNSTGMFADLTSAHLLNKKSVDDLNERLKVKDVQVSIHNFRPNIVLETTPYAEDEWDWVKIGDVVFQLVKPCTRCVLTTINPETGIKNEQAEPLKTLRQYHILENLELRKIENYAPVMGLNLGVKQAGIVHVGDEVWVTKNSSIKVMK